MTEKKKTPSDILGYSYIIFQNLGNGFIKCFLDGNPNYTYFAEDYFLNMLSMIDSSYYFIQEVKEALTYTNIYIWDVDNYKIKILNSKSTPDSLTSDLNNSFKNIMKSNKGRRYFSS